jgi:NAD(P)-dependent dehydrogenase (short-subunit alcohol dehydrogenase family)
MSLNTPISTWQGLRVWVIGASTGIGAAAAEQLYAQAARVIVSARKAEALEQFAAGKDSERAMALPLDIADRAAVLAAATQIEERWGAPDLTLVVAGTYNEMRAWEFDRDVAAKLLDINLNGPLNVMEAMLPRLLKERERRKGYLGIGFVASVAGYRGLPKALIYGPSKAALINMAEALYFDLAPKDIGVHCINPGFVDTPLTKGNDFHMPDLMSPQDAAREMLAGIKAGEFEISFPKSFTRKVKFARLLPPTAYFKLLRLTTKL